MRGAEGFARSAEEISFQRFLWCKSDGMQKQVEPIGLAADVAKESLDLLVSRYVTRINRRVCTEFADQFFDVLFQSFALIIEDETRARRGPGFGDRPRDTA